MANTSNPRGLVPVRYRNGSSWDGKVTPYYLGTGVGAVYIGDPLILSGTANAAEISRIGGRFRPGALPGAVLATAGSDNPIAGIVTGFMPLHRDSEIYGVASTERIALVSDDVNVVYQVQDDGSGSGLGIATVGLNADLVAGGGGSTVTGLSSWQLDATTPNTTANFQVKILNISNIIDRENNLDEDYITWDVVINRSHWLAAAGAVGI